MHRSCTASKAIKYPLFFYHNIDYRGTQPKNQSIPIALKLLSHIFNSSNKNTFLYHIGTTYYHRLLLIGTNNMRLLIETTMFTGLLVRTDVH